MTSKFWTISVCLCLALKAALGFEKLSCHILAKQTLLTAFMPILTTCCLISPLPAYGQELLRNPSFEAPVGRSEGNNFFLETSSWTVTHSETANRAPVNIVRPHAGYGNHALATPTGGGVQYLDVQSPMVILEQTVTFPTSGLVDLSGWYSVREGPRAVTGLVINVRNSNNVIVASANTSFSAADPMGLWKSAAASNIPVTAGVHTFEVTLPDFANFDLASLVFKPAITVTKTSNAFSDAVSLANPKMIPGAIAEYRITVATPAEYAITNNSLLLTDAVPPNMSLVVIHQDAPGIGPAFFTSGTSGLTYKFLSLASRTDDVEFSNNDGLSWTYTPRPAQDGTDSAVTTIRLRPKGSMAPNASLIFRLRFKIQ